MVPMLLLIYLCLANGAKLNETEKAVTVSGKGRALNTGNLTQPESALDDVSMEEDELSTTCIEGETVDHGCEEKCVCVKGKLQCKPRCEPPTVRNRLVPDHNCYMKPSTEDTCCSILVCSSEGQEEEVHEKPCVFKNETYKFGEVFHDGCTSTCSCLESGEVNCKPRCPQTNQTASLDRCLSVADAKDPCCSILYCDVNAGDELISEDDVMDRVKLVSAVAANSTTVLLNFDKMSVVDEVHAEISRDQMNWTQAETIGQAVIGLKPGVTYYFRVINDGVPSNVVSATLPNLIKGSSECEFKGKTYKIGENFHDGCTAYCSCTPTGIECAPIDCPTDFGLDVLDPKCLAWDIRPENFTATPPKCCPENVVCKNNGTCVYKGETFENWADIPDKLSGCEEKCYCSGGNVTCRPRCPIVPSSPPPEVPCPSTQAILTHPPGDDCCLRWMCPQQTGVPPPHSLPGFPPHSPHESNSIAVHHLEAVDENTVRLVFSVPLVLVGLHGRVELRYTADNKNSDPSTWEQQVLAPPNDLIATPELEFELRGLQPDTEYKIKITVVMRDIQNSPASQVLVVKTPPPAVSSTLPPIILVEPDLHVIKVNSTWATLGWRKFTDYEMQFIDGVQLRYKEIDDKVYQATPLIHRAVTSYSIEDLKPDSQYNLGIFFIPFPGQNTELQAQKTINLSTAIENDPYKFELLLDVHHIKSQSVEVRWSGVPYPEDKYVNIFRAIYQFEGGREEKNSFKVAKRDSPAGTLITGLQPDTRYRLWLEAYLTNGRIKKSNVKDFTTKQGNFQSSDVHQGKLEGASIQESNDYYGPLVGVSILAAIAIITALGLLFLIARKHGHNKAPITAAVQRKSAPHTAAYDNPSYKVEMQHETMDL